jgi:hypothetical protein
MSQGFDSDSFWVSDIDGYVSLSAIQAANEWEEQSRFVDEQLEAIGEIKLLSMKSISAHELNARGVTVEEWRWALHEANASLAGSYLWHETERPFLRALISMGKAYAINRYSRWENVPHSSVITATLPFGLRALLNQYLTGEGVKAPAQGSWWWSVLNEAAQKSDLVAYDRTGVLRTAIYALATAPGNPGSGALGRESTRTLLSLARLHYSVGEINVGSLEEIRSLEKLYLVARSNASNHEDGRVSTGEKCIKNWTLRHLHPLTYLFPYAVRHALKRALGHGALTPDAPDREILLNELALARCGILLMRREARKRRQLR